MKIALVSEHANPMAALGGVDAGGQNVFVAELARRLVALGHEVTVYTRCDGSGPHHVRTADGVSIEQIIAGPTHPIAKDDIFGFLGAFADGLVRAWRRDRPDVIHAHFWMSGIAALDARLRSGISAPVLQTFHALGHVKRRHQHAEDTSPEQRIALERHLAQNVDAVIATCSDEVRELRELDADRSRVHVIPCGVDIDRFQPMQGERTGRRVLSIGRLVPRKGVDTVIRAVALLPGVQLQIAGGSGHEWSSDPEVQRLRGLSEELGIAGRVHFLGPVPRDQVPALIASADVVATLPWYEPFGLVPLEAMACGVPVVGSAVGGLLDSVVSGSTGLLVPPADHVTAAAAMGRLLSRPDQLQAMGRAGAKRARERFGWDHVVAQTAELYERLILDEGRATPVIDLRSRRNLQEVDAHA